MVKLHQYTPKSKAQSEAKNHKWNKLHNNNNKLHNKCNNNNKENNGVKLLHKHQDQFIWVEMKKMNGLPL